MTNSRLSVHQFAYKVVRNYVVSSVAIQTKIKLEDLKQVVKRILPDFTLLQAKFITIDGRYHGYKLQEPDDLLEQLPINFKVLDGEDQFNHYLNQKLTHPLSFDNKAIWQLDLVHLEGKPNQSKLIFTVHHAFFDTSSICYFLAAIKDVYLSGNKKYKKILGSIEGLSYEGFKKKSINYKVLISVLNHLKNLLTFRNKLKLCHQAGSSSIKYQVKQLTHTFNKEKTNQIIDFCRQNDFTFLCLLTTLVILGVKTTFNINRKFYFPFIFGSDYRNRLHIKNNEYLIGTHAVGNEVNVNIDKYSNFISLSKYIKNKIRKSLKITEEITWGAKINGLQAQILKKIVSSKNDFYCPLLVSNMGKIDYINNGSDFYDDFFFTGTSPYGGNIGIRLTSSYINNKTSISFSWNEGELDSEKMKLVFDDMVSKLIDLEGILDMDSLLDD